MKLFTLLAAGTLALVTAVTASAQTTIRLAASNGDRQATQKAISLIFDTGTPWRYRGLNGVAEFDGSGYTTGSVATVTGSNFGTWRGIFGGQEVIIKTNYAGALAGVAAVSSSPQIPQRFDVSNGLGSGNIPNPLNGSTLGTDYEEGIVDFGFSTNFQSTSPFIGEYNGHNYVAVEETIVGVSPLGFYASPGFPVNNITIQQAQLLYKTGSVPLSIFTGNWTNGDQNKIVYAIGRNTDAGQRFGAVGEIGFGTTGAVVHWQPTISGQTTTSGITYGGTVTSHKVWNGEVVSNIPSPGSSGYSGGANLAPSLTVTLGPDAYKGRFEEEDDEGNIIVGYLYPDATAGYYIGYLTPGDADSRVLGTTGVVPPENRGVKLNYNGVENTQANVRSGLYTLWLYNRLLTPLGGVTTGATQASFAEALKNRIQTETATEGGGILHDANFKVKRNTDGGSILPRF